MEREVRIRGTINDVVTVDGLDGTETDEEIVRMAELDWQYVEYEDMWGEIE
jgi:hypothetical protein